MVKHKFLMIQDDDGTSFSEVLREYLESGWIVMPGTLGFTSLQVRVKSLGFETNNTKSVVVGYAVIEMDDSNGNTR